MLIPRYPGVLCAFGLLVADVIRDYSQTVLQPVTDDSTEALQERLEAMIAQARDDLRDEAIAESAMRFTATVDMRYVGQSFELSVPVGPDLVQAFHEAHSRAYGHALYTRGVEVVNLRLQAVGLVEKPVLTPQPLVEAEAPVLGGSGDTHFYERTQLQPGMRFEGPALVFQLDSTTYIAEGWTAFVDAYENLILERL